MVNFLNKCAIICYSTPNYERLKNISFQSLLHLGIDINNIKHKLDYPPKELMKETGFMTDLFYYCIIHKIEHLINSLKSYDYEYYICLDLDIWFLKNNENEWENIKTIVDNSFNDIFFMRENNTNDVNGGFYIIKNKNKDIIIDFFSQIYNTLLIKNKNELPFADQTLINENKHKINFEYIPNDYVIWGNCIYNKEKALFHHAVCCRDVDDKINQINNIKSHFDVIIFLNTTYYYGYGDSFIEIIFEKAGKYILNNSLFVKDPCFGIVKYLKDKENNILLYEYSSFTII